MVEQQNQRSPTTNPEITSVDAPRRRSRNSHSDFVPGTGNFPSQAVDEELPHEVPAILQQQQGPFVLEDVLEYIQTEPQYADDNKGFAAVPPECQIATGFADDVSVETSAIETKPNDDVTSDSVDYVELKTFNFEKEVPKSDPINGAGDSYEAMETDDVPELKEESFEHVKQDGYLNMLYGVDDVPTSQFSSFSLQSPTSTVPVLKFPEQTNNSVFFYQVIRPYEYTCTIVSEDVKIPEQSQLFPFESEMLHKPQTPAEGFQQQNSNIPNLDVFQGAKSPEEAENEDTPDFPEIECGVSNAPSKVHYVSLSRELRSKMAEHKDSIKKLQVHRFVGEMLWSSLKKQTPFHGKIFFSDPQGSPQDFPCRNFTVKDTKFVGELWCFLKRNKTHTFDTFCKAMRVARKSGFFDYLDEGKGKKKKIYKLGQKSLVDYERLFQWIIE